MLCIQLGTPYRQYIFKVDKFSKEELQPVFDIIESEDWVKIGHNLKFDYKFLSIILQSKLFEFSW